MVKEDEESIDSGQKGKNQDSKGRGRKDKKRKAKRSSSFMEKKQG